MTIAADANTALVTCNVNLLCSTVVGGGISSVLPSKKYGQEVTRCFFYTLALDRRFDKHQLCVGLRHHRGNVCHLALRLHVDCGLYWQESFPTVATGEQTVVE